MTEETLKGITRDDVTAFHQAYFRPGRALISVVGDVQAATVKGVVEKALAAWPAGGDKPAFTYPATPGSGSDDDLSGRQAGCRAVDVRDRAFPGRRARRRTFTRCRS